MNATIFAVLLALALCGAVFLGAFFRRFLPEDHLSESSKDAVKLAMGLVATMTALLLGLLVSSAKDTYDTQRGEVIEMAAKVALLDRVLTSYGPEASEARAQFRDAVAETNRRMWPIDANAAVDLAVKAKTADSLYAALHALSPSDEFRLGLKAKATALAEELAMIRTMMLAQSAPSVSRPLLWAVSFWLALIFFCFSLMAPPNTTTAFAQAAAALSVAVAIFLVLEFDSPLGGTLRISGEPMQNALAQMAE